MAGITMLAGGVGAAKLLRGLARLTDPENLTVIVNTGDDDEFYGLSVSPDLDTIVYTLAGMASRRTGWGIARDRFTALAELEVLTGQDAWFNLGDRDLATHIFRTQQLGRGRRLSQVTSDICKARGVRARVLPMSDDRVRTVAVTDRGRLSFQHYLVRERARPKVLRLSFTGALRARPAPGVLSAIARAKTVVIAPSNPLVSIAPMLTVPGIRQALRRARSRVVAVSPLIGGRSVKGPLPAMLRSMSLGRGTAAIAEFYRGLAGHLVVAPGDLPSRRQPGWPELVEHDTLIGDVGRARRLAKFMLELGTQDS
ncbi:MAG: 2-phospho-L-lactate transferase [Deltaproteobacteria bacterium]